MADWSKISGRGNVADRRMFGPTAIGGGLGLTGLLIVIAFNLLSGGNVGDVLTQLGTTQVGNVQTYNSQDFEGADAYETFASTVLGSNNEMWHQVFTENGENYSEPSLVLFRESTESGCGGASSDAGPHYCPLDQTIYLDETFFDQLRARFGAEGGDVAEAYVMAHEVGHHVQNLLGILDENKSERDSIVTELQADCFAGLWAYSIRDLGVLEPGEIQEAMDAAAAVGDDNIQRTITGRVNPETWTHGSSKDRVDAFTRGYQNGTVSACEMGG
jgi:predicted metalloprotease